MQSTYLDIFMNQMFTTLGQLTAVLVSGAVAVPMVTYYSDNLKYFNVYFTVTELAENTNTNTKKQNVFTGDLFVDGDIKCSGDVLAYYKKKD